VVVKRVLPELLDDPSFAAMFVAEARILSRLAHVNIVQVFEFGEVDGQYFLALEYVRGRDLRAAIDARIRGAFPPGLAALVARDVARALGHVHAICDERGAPMRLVHRDVSPGNVMIGFDGAVKLLDFGIAKPLAENTRTNTAPGTLKGKIAYMAPEQVDGLALDGRADLYSLGVLLHEMLTGQPLFDDSPNLGEVLDARLAPEPPSRRNPSVPPELDRICMKALAERREDRFASGEEVSAELDTVVRQLGASREALVAEMRALFPDDVAERRPALPGGGTRQLKEPERPRRRRWGPIAAVVAVVLGATAAAWAVHRMRTTSPAPVVQSPPPRAVVEAPPPAPVELAAPPAHPRQPAAVRAPARKGSPHRPADRPGAGAPPAPKERAKENLHKGDIVDPFHH
jgi:hypothetical protein